MMGTPVLALYQQYFTNSKYVVYFPNGSATASAYYGLTMAAQNTASCMVQYRTIPPASGWQSILCTNTDNQGLRLNSNQLNTGDANDFLNPGGFAVYDGTYASSTPYLTSTDNVWHTICASRNSNSQLALIHIGHPDVTFSSGSLLNRSFYGYMSEVVTMSTSLPTMSAATTSCPAYDIFYKNAHIPSWQNGLIASYIPENWTGSAWVNGTFGNTLPVTTYTGTITRATTTNYQNIFTNLSTNAQNSCRSIYSYRRVNTLYTGPTFRLRRSSDNVTLDFYADAAGNLGTGLGASGTPLIEWLGAGSYGGAIAYVDTWYDQSLNARNATQTTWSLQPYLSTSKRCVDFTGSSYMNLPTGTVPMQTTYTFVARHGYVGNANGGIIGAGSSSGSPTGNGNCLRTDASQGYWNYWYNNDAGANLGGPPAKENTVTCRYDGPTTTGTTYFFVNGVQTNSTTRNTAWYGTTGNDQLGKTTFDVTLNGTLYDCFTFSSSLSDADRQVIENVLINSSSQLPVLYGPSTSTLTFPTGVLPSTYTMLHVAKYQKPSRGSNSRIFSGSAQNWLSGFWNGLSGVAYHNNWLTQSAASLHGTNWVLSTDQNSLYRSLSATRSTAGPGTPSYDTIAINTGFTAGESSDWAIQGVMVYNRTLSAAEYRMAEDFLANRYKIPVPSQESLVLSLDASDYLTTSGTTWSDRSVNGYNFTLSSASAYNSSGTNPTWTLPHMGLCVQLPQTSHTPHTTQSYILEQLRTRRLIGGHSCVDTVLITMLLLKPVQIVWVCIIREVDLSHVTKM
jgi:hypothetical protein